MVRENCREPVHGGAEEGGDAPRPGSLKVGRQFLGEEGVAVVDCRDTEPASRRPGDQDPFVVVTIKELDPLAAGDRNDLEEKEEVEKGFDKGGTRLDPPAGDSVGRPVEDVSGIRGKVSDRVGDHVDGISARGQDPGHLSNEDLRSLARGKRAGRHHPDDHPLSRHPPGPASDFSSR